MDSPSIINCKNRIIKYSTNNITFFENGHVYKQFPFDNFKWVNEMFIVNYLDNPNIIKFNQCEIVYDYIIDTKNKEIVLDKKEKVVRITMDKYDATLYNIKKYTDKEIFFIMNKLLSALLYCRSKEILHRDIKEKNIFINYNIESSYFGRKKRNITNVVLADFNISKYKYKISSLNRPEIMTVTHRPPEISKAIRDQQHFDYDERIDVWSFCIVLSYLITGKSFYAFLSKSYLVIDPNILYDITKLNIIMVHFIKIFSYKKLKHITFYKKIINNGMLSYKQRKTFRELHILVYNYGKKHNIQINEETFSPISSSPECVILSRILKNNVIKKLHDILHHNDIQLILYYKIYTHMSVRNFNFNIIHMVALYILVSFLVLDNAKSIDFYLSKINSIISHDKVKREIKKEEIEMAVINIVKVNTYSII